jgi:Ca2+-binding RTX toxin-like protein
MGFQTGNATDNFFFSTLDPSDTINGLGGNDTVSYDSPSAADGPVRVDLAIAAAQNTSGSRWDQLISIENLIGSRFSDTLFGNAEANVIDGGSGLGDDRLDGRGGVDTASYASASAGVTVSLALAGPQNTVGAGIDSLANFENLRGSSFSDTLSGNNANNRIEGGKGADVLTGSRGADWLAGGSGADRFRYLAVAESPNSPNLCDRILDFNPAEPNERIDVSAIDANSFLAGNQAFVWKGLIANPLALAVGELGYTSGGGISVVYGRSTASVDFSLRLDGVSALAAGHFIL